jgi:hypothetical protein
MKNTRNWGISLTQEQLELLQKTRAETGIPLSQLLIRSFLKVYGPEVKK